MPVDARTKSRLSDFLSLFEYADVFGEKRTILDINEDVSLTSILALISFDYSTDGLVEHIGVNRPIPIVESAITQWRAFYKAKGATDADLDAILFRISAPGIITLGRRGSELAGVVDHTRGSSSQMPQRLVSERALEEDSAYVARFPSPSHFVQFASPEPPSLGNFTYGTSSINGRFTDIDVGNDVSIDDYMDALVAESPDDPITNKVMSDINRIARSINPAAEYVTTLIVPTYGGSADRMNWADLLMSSRSGTGVSGNLTPQAIVGRLPHLQNISVTWVASAFSSYITAWAAKLNILFSVYNGSVIAKRDMESVPPWARFDTTNGGSSLAANQWHWQDYSAHVPHIEDLMLSQGYASLYLPPLQIAKIPGFAIVPVYRVPRSGDFANVARLDYSSVQVRAGVASGESCVFLYDGKATEPYSEVLFGLPREAYTSHLVANSGGYAAKRARSWNIAFWKQRRAHYMGNGDGGQGNALIQYHSAPNVPTVKVGINGYMIHLMVRNTSSRVINGLRIFTLRPPENGDPIYRVSCESSSTFSTEVQPVALNNGVVYVSGRSHSLSAAKSSLPEDLQTMEFPSLSLFHTWNRQALGQLSSFGTFHVMTGLHGFAHQFLTFSRISSSQEIVGGWTFQSIRCSVLTNSGVFALKGLSHLTAKLPDRSKLQDLENLLVTNPDSHTKWFWSRYSDSKSAGFDLTSTGLWKDLVKGKINMETEVAIPKQVDDDGSVVQEQLTWNQLSARSRSARGKTMYSTISTSQARSFVDGLSMGVSVAGVAKLSVVPLLKNGDLIFLPIPLKVDGTWDDHVLDELFPRSARVPTVYTHAVTGGPFDFFDYVPFVQDDENDFIPVFLELMASGVQAEIESVPTQLLANEADCEKFFVRQWYDGDLNTFTDMLLDNLYDASPAAKVDKYTLDPDALCPTGFIDPQAVNDDVWIRLVTMSDMLYGNTVNSINKMVISCSV